MADESRPFVIEVKRRWLLAILPILATLYFVAVVLLTLLDYRIQGVTTDMLVFAGIGIFVLVMLIEFPFFLRRRRPKAPRARRAAKAAAQPETVEWDDEYLATDEEQQGLRVLEYSAPAKSQNTNTVFTKTYVAVTSAHVMRIETAVADATEI